MGFCDTIVIQPHVIYNHKATSLLESSHTWLLLLYFPRARVWTENVFNWQITSHELTSNSFNSNQLLPCVSDHVSDHPKPDQPINQQHYTQSVTRSIRLLSKHAGLYNACFEIWRASFAEDKKNYVRERAGKFQIRRYAIEIFTFFKAITSLWRILVRSALTRCDLGKATWRVEDFDSLSTVIFFNRFIYRHSSLLLSFRGGNVERRKKVRDNAAADSTDNDAIVLGK